MYISPAETVDTVNVSTSSFDAEQGMAGGAAVTVITKSGTNKFKGSAFEGFNSDKLNAKPVLLRRRAGARQAAGQGEQLRRHGRRADQARTRCSSSVRSKATSGRRACSPSSACPTPALRAGDFSKAFNTNGIAADHLQPVDRQPPTAPAASSSRTTRFRTTMINPIALKILQLFPMPNSPGIGAGG